MSDRKLYAFVERTPQNRARYKALAKINEQLPPAIKQQCEVKWAPRFVILYTTTDMNPVEKKLVHVDESATYRWHENAGDILGQDPQALVASIE